MTHDMPILPVEAAPPVPADAPYRDPSRPVDERVDDLVGRMTLAEKISQLTAAWITYDPDTGEVAPSNFGDDAATGDTALEEVLAHGVGQITRPLGSRPIDPVDGARMINELQRRMVADTRLGIPAICHEECLSGLMAQGATSFPSPLNLASTWDPELARRVGDVIRRQMRSVGTHQGLAPVADVARDARWGRVEETLGEDPYLVGCMVTAYVRGLQGPDPATGVIATLKHFVAYSGSEGGRNFAPTHVGPRELGDVFLPPFEMAVREGGARSVMCSYQDVDGEAPAGSRRLLTEVLRDRWGFDGFVVADYGAVGFLHRLHRVAADPVEASALAIGAGLDVELPGPSEFPVGVPGALEQGLLDLAQVDGAVRRVLRQKFLLGIFEQPYVDVSALELDTAEDRALAADVAARSIILLANPGRILPLDPAACGTVAVVGPNADDVMALFGNYSYENHVVSTHFPDARDTIDAPTVLGALVARLGAERIGHVAGCQVMSDDPSGIDEAVDLAARSDVAVVVLGDTAGHFRLGTVGEGSDTADLSLPGAQGALVDGVVATGTPTVVVLLNGRPFALADLGERAAVVEAWFPGQAGASAVVEVLFGDAEPAGRTPLTFSTGAGVQPTSYRHTYLSPGFPRLPEFAPVFPFGHGLGYARMVYSDLVISEEVPVDGTVELVCAVTNESERSGTDVVQLYAHDPLASVTRPLRELCGFARVDLAPGEAVEVAFAVPVDLLSFCGLDGQRIVEAGRIEFAVGASSADRRLVGATTLVGPTRIVGEGRRLSTAVAIRDRPAR